MKTVFIFLVFTFIGYAGSLADFTKEFVCDNYNVRSVEFDEANGMKRLMFVEYKYVNKSLILIDTYDNRLNDQGKEEVNELKSLFLKRRSLMDDLIGVNKDMTLDSLSLLYSVYKDDNIGIAMDIFKVFGLNKQKIRNLGDSLDSLDKSIKSKILDFVKVDPLINSISCN